MIKNFEVGAVLSSTFSVYFSNIVAFFAIGLMFNLPVIVLNYLSSSGDLLDVVDPSLYLAIPLAVGLLTLIFGNVVTGAISFGVFQFLRGKKPSIGSCIAKGFSVLLPVIGVAILVGLMVFFGSLLCLIPGIILYVMFCTAVPVTVVERPGVINSLKRSLDLSSGNRMAIFAVLLVLTLMNIAITLGITFSVAALGNIALIISGLVSVVLGGLGSTALVVIYYHLRSSKESIDVEEIAQVFD